MTNLEALALADAKPAATHIEEEFEFVPLIAADAPKPDFRNGKNDKPSATYTYRDADGAPLWYCRRFDYHDGRKEFLPLTLWRENDTGTLVWRSKGVPHKKTLYGLELLSSRPESPVVVTEGEKACEAARILLPDCIVVTSSGGSNVAKSTDWGALKGRKVYIWPDADSPGKMYADAVTKALHEHSVTAYVIDVPADVASGWDAADAQQEGWDTERTIALLERAKPLRPATRMPDSYKITGRNLYCEYGDKPPLKISSAIEVAAYTRSFEGENWGRLLKWQDRDGRKHKWAMPMEMLSGDGNDVIATLMRKGMMITPHRTAKQQFFAYLQLCDPAWSATSADKIGWHQNHFIFHDAVVPETDEIYLQTDSSYEYGYNCSGTLAEWQQEVASRAKGNSRLILAMCVAFAAPLLRLTNGEGGCYHLRGASSIGKSTALLFASSIWGGGNKPYIQQWRSTANALEITAEAHNDSLLCLDEFGQIDAKEAEHVAYMLANGSGKNRMRSKGGARNKHQWLNLVFSSGEISLEQKLAEAGRQIKAGMEIRFVDIPADASAGFGLFENIFEFESAAELAKHLSVACKKYYGIPIRCYLSELCGLNNDEITHDYKYYRDEFMTRYVPENSDSQVRRVADRMGLLVAAGVFASRFEIIPLGENDIFEAIGKCFKAWLEARGTHGNAESHRVLSQVSAFFQQSQHRFIEIVTGNKSGDIVDDSKTTIAPAGYKQINAEGEYEYFVSAEFFKKEIGKGYDYSSACRELISRKLLITDADGRATRLKRIKNMSKRTRFMHFSSEILGDVTNLNAE